eukprot:5174226-Amphidinium_carterae.1
MKHTHTLAQRTSQQARASPLAIFRTPGNQSMPAPKNWDVDPCSNLQEQVIFRLRATGVLPAHGPNHWRDPRIGVLQTCTPEGPRWS